MKSVVITLAIILCAVGPAAGVVDQLGDKKSAHGVERTVATGASVTVTLCVMSGQITVRGWNKSEVRARSADAEGIELKRIDAAGEESKPAKKIDIFVYDKSDEDRPRGDCQASADVALDVPQGATVQVQTRDGDISIVGVDAAYAGSQNGDICIENVKHKIEAGSIGGGISVRDSSGRVTLSSAGGGIEATNVTPVEADDNFEVTSVSGDIQLEKVSHAKLSARSVTGNVNLVGSLARSGNYGFNTMSGDVTLSLPGNASFRLVAKLSLDGEIVTDFPLTITTETVPSPKAPAVKTPRPSGAPPLAPATPTPKAAPTPLNVSPKVEVIENDPGDANVTIVTVAPVAKATRAVVAIPYTLRRIVAVHGSGDAAISVASFSGTLRLQKN